MAVKRVLVTGSRDWDDVQCIRLAIADAHLELGDFILVSGQCPTGADNIAELEVAKLGMPVELHPAEWNKHSDWCPDWHLSLPRCKSAGFRRNKEMVDSGIDLCIAFIKDESRGASMTVKLALRADIETMVWIKVNKNKVEL